MKQAIPNLLKLVAALAATTVIFYLVLPEEEVNDEVLNASLEFLGKKLMAMAPKEQQPHVQQAFDEFCEQTREGKVSKEHVESVAVTILNTDAEGGRLEQKQIDSLLAAIRITKAKKRASEQQLRVLGERLHAYRRFEERWKRMMPEAEPAISRAPRPRPLFRVAPNFVVQIDSAAIAELAIVHAEHLAARVPAAIAVSGPNMEEIIKELSRDLPNLDIEMGHVNLQIRMADSLKKVHLHMADSLKKAALQYKMEQLRRMPPRVPPPTEAKPEKRKQSE